MKKIEHIAALVNTMNTAIKSGDWKVDGACDPEIYLSMAEAMLEQEGWTRKRGDWTPDYDCAQCKYNGNQMICPSECTGCGGNDEMDNFALAV